MPTAAQVQAVERLVHESVAKVDALAPGQLQSLIPALRAARDELQKDLAKWLSSGAGAEDKFTAYQKTAALRSVEAALARIQALQPAMAGALGKGLHQTGALAVAALDDEVKRLSSIFGGGMVTMPQIDTAAVIAEGKKLLWKGYESSAKRYAGGVGDDIRSRLSVSLAKGDTFEQMVQRLRGSVPFKQAVSMSDPNAASHGVADAMFHRWRHWADRLVRTENMHAYNVQHDIAIDHANENRPEGEDEYLRRWDATADKVTCPRCAELDRTVTTIDGEFKGGIKSPPLHPYCRCVVLAWLARWGHMKGEVPAKHEDGRDIEPARDVRKPLPKPAPPSELGTPHDEIAAERRSRSSKDAKAAAAQDLAAFDTHEKKKASDKAMEEQIAKAKIKQAKALEDLKAKLAADKAVKQAAADKLAAEQAAAAKAAHDALLAAQKATADAAKAAADAAKKAADDAAKAAKLAATKAKKTAALTASAAPFDPNTSGVIGNIPKGKAKGKAHLLAKPGMVQIDASTIKGHGYHVTWDPSIGKWVTQSGPADQGMQFNWNTQKWSPKNAPAVVAPPTPAPKPAPAAALGPEPAPIKGYEWKAVGNKWVLHQNGVPTSQLVQPYKYGSSPMMSDTYSLGGDLAKHGLVATGPGVMEGHGYKFEKSASGTWYKTESLGQPYKNPSAVAAVAATKTGGIVDGVNWDTSLGSAPSSHPSGFSRMSLAELRQASNEDHKALSSAEHSGVYAYSGSSYASINGDNTSKGLRNPPPSAGAQAHIRNMDKAFKNPTARMRKDAILFRGCGGLDYFDKFDVGGEFDDKGFVSTSMSTENGFYRGGQVRFHISVPAGHPSIAMGTPDMSAHSGEKEVLLPRGSKFRVLKKEMIDGRLYLHVEVLPHVP